MNKACRTVVEKSAALAEAMGIRLPAQQRLTTLQPLPMSVPVIGPRDLNSLDEIVENAPSVAATKAKVDAATPKFQQAKRSFGPNITFAARKNYSGQSINSYCTANRHIDPRDYRVGLGIQPPPFPVGAEVAGGRQGSRRAKEGTSRLRPGTARSRYQAGTRSRIGNCFRV